MMELKYRRAVREDIPSLMEIRKRQLLDEGQVPDANITTCCEGRNRANNYASSSRYPEESFVLSSVIAYFIQSVNAARRAVLSVF